MLLESIRLVCRCRMKRKRIGKSYYFSNIRKIRESVKSGIGEGRNLKKKKEYACRGIWGFRRKRELLTVNTVCEQGMQRRENGRNESRGRRWAAMTNTRKMKLWQETFVCSLHRCLKHFIIVKWNSFPDITGRCVKITGRERRRARGDVFVTACKGSPCEKYSVLNDFGRFKKMRM